MISSSNRAAGDKAVVVADYDDDTFETIHLTQVALGSKPAKGPHTVFVERDGATGVTVCRILAIFSLTG